MKELEEEVGRYKKENNKLENCHKEITAKITHLEKDLKEKDSKHEELLQNQLT